MYSFVVYSKIEISIAHTSHTYGTCICRLFPVACAYTKYHNGQSIVLMDMQFDIHVLFMGSHSNMQFSVDVMWSNGN